MFGVMSAYSLDIPEEGHSQNHCPIKAGVNMNLSEISRKFKERLQRKKKGYGTPPDSCPTPQWHPRLVGNCLVCIYQFLISNYNFKTTPNLQNFLFP